MSYARIESLERRLFLSVAPVVYGGTGSGSRISIPNNDTTPSLTDSTNFGYDTVNEYNVTRTFVIENHDTSALNLRASGAVTLSGQSGDSTPAFSVQTQPATTIAAADGTTYRSATFTIKFHPVAAGDKTALVNIVADDGSTIFSFTIEGTAVTGTPLSNSAGTMEYNTTHAGSGTAAANGDVVAMYYSGYLLDGTPSTKFNFDSKLSSSNTPLEVNLGAGAVIKGWDLGLVGMQAGETRVLFIPAALGYGTTSQANIPANSTLIFEVTLARFGANLTVSGHSTSITNGDTIPSQTDYTDLGKASVGVTIPRTFTISSTVLGGLPTGAITASNVSITNQTDAGEFQVVSASNSSVVVSFTPTNQGHSTATLTIATKWAGSPSFSFTIGADTYNDVPGVGYTYDAVVVEGGSGNDTARIDLITNQDSTTSYQVTLNGVEWLQPSTGITHLLMGGGAGNDTLTVPDNITIPVTVDGEAGNDTLIGGTGSHITMEGGDGNDWLAMNGDTTIGASLSGGAGNDLILGGGGADTISGGDGNDSIRGGAGDDSISGDAGNDTLFGGAGNDTLSGGLGADLISGGAGTDTATYADAGRTKGVKVTLDGIANNDGSSQDSAGGSSTAAGDSVDVENITGTDFADTLVGSSGANVLDGGKGNDSISGGAGNDTIHGGDGNDTLSGDAGDDSIAGGAGNDLINGNDGADSISGDAGNDTINGGSGNDTIAAGDGADSLNGNDGNDSISGDAGNDTLHGGAGNDAVSGGDGNDSVYGDAGNDSLHGNAGNDHIYGGDGNDLLFGNAGNDSLQGEAGNDVMWGGSGADVFSGGNGQDAVSYNEGLTTGDPSRTTGVKVTQNGIADDGSSVDVSGARKDNVGSDIEIIGTTNYADTVIAGGAGDRIIWTYAGNDSIVGGAGNDEIWGGAGDDTIRGMAGNDRLYGDDSTNNSNAGDDVIYGGDGSDTITGGAGADKLYGQAGNNVIYSRDQEVDTVDGGSGKDQLQKDAIDSVTGVEQLLA